jgi:hypothetical protein
MQFDRQRAFPYPVLRPDVNDYLDGDFQVTADLQPSGSDMSVVATFQCALSVAEINKEIQRLNASFAIVVSCRETYYRETIFGHENSITRAFPGGALRGEVQISPYVVTRKRIKSFRCALINDEFGAGPFDFSAGSILALDEPKIIYVSRDVFQPITSIFQLVVDPNINGSEWRLRLNQPKVSIALSAAVKEKIDLARNSPKNKAILINSIYFASVMQCIRSLRDQTDYDDYRWAQVMRQQCHNLGIQLTVEDEYLISERLMKFPLGLLAAYVFGDTE